MASIWSYAIGCSYNRRGPDPNCKAHSAQSLKFIPMECQTKR